MFMMMMMMNTHLQP